MGMDTNTEIWRSYYEKALAKPHLKRTEFVCSLNQSTSKVAIDCGCGVGSDMEFLSQHGYRVYGFDINSDSIEICEERFADNPLVDVTNASFEQFQYPKAGIVLANSSLFFADPSQFESVWHKIVACIEIGGVFAGDFMGVKDTWATHYRSPTSSFTESEVRDLFFSFEVLRFHERDEMATTALGRMKHWHTYSVVAVKR